MDYSLCVKDNDKSNVLNEENLRNIYQCDLDLEDCDLGHPVQKKQKCEESLFYQQSNENVKQLIDDWVTEYNKWYKITIGNDENIETKVINNQPNIRGDYTNNMYNQYYTDNNALLQNSIGQLSNFSNVFVQNQIQQNTASIPSQQFYNNNNSNQRIKQSRVSMGYWGPLLRYGTYGVHAIYKHNVCLNKNILSNKRLKNNLKYRIPLQYPLDLPLRIRMPRQAMIYTLQSKIKAYLYDLKKIEKDPFLHMNVNYSNALEQATKKCGTCPKYLFTKVKNLPLTEREYFTSLKEIDSCNSYLSMDGSLRIEIKSTNDFYACELFIGDIIISQGFALWKRRAREICARNAFRVFEKPCYLVGSTRFWYGTDYMTACVTDDSSIVPLLPPFLTDPTEPLYKKDEKINESDPNENFDVLNPKSIHDFWLYAITLKSIDNIKSVDPQMLLYLSAEFSQMNLSFEVDSCWDESFACTIILDKSPAIKVDGLGSLEQACQAAALVLVDKLVDTQPIVTLNEDYHQKYVNLETNHNEDNAFLVQSLMWAQSDTPIDFKDLSDLITAETFLSVDKLNKVSSRELLSDENDLEYFFNIYAQSSLVNPMRMNKTSIVKELWSLVPHKVKKCGLVVMNESIECSTDGAFLICKQVPHTQLKSMLLKNKVFRAFKLLTVGNLPADYLSNLNQFINYDNSGDSLNSNDDIVRHSESNDHDFLSEKSSLYSDIIRDVERDSIPGLDF